MNHGQSKRTALVLIIFVAVFLTLTMISSQRESATDDEPQHLTTGYMMLKYHDFRLDPEHPPFLRMWAALPLLAMSDVKADTQSPLWLKPAEWPFCRQFLFVDNSPDRLLARGRTMIALLGVLLGVLVFCWARELFGFWPAVIVLGLFSTEPNLMAHAGLVTTDIGATCFMFGAVYFAWRLARRFSPGNLVGLTVFFTVAQISKYSAILLVPIVFAILFFRVLSPKPWPGLTPQSRPFTTRAVKGWLALFTAVGLLLASYLALWGIYDFRYAPTPYGIEKAHFVLPPDARQSLSRLGQVMQWADDHRLVPNACAKGFISMALNTQVRKAYLFGDYSTTGWWYYFPVAILIKTPIGLLVMAAAGLALGVRQWRATPLDGLAVAGPIVVFLGAAMASHLNIGLRHVLPIYPFILLLTGWTVAALWPVAAARPRWRSFVLAGLCLAQVVEFGVTYPDCLAFFNRSVGGPAHGADYLVDSNLDWGQGLKLLKQWMTDHHVQTINLSYFGSADPAYYGITYTPLPGSPEFLRSRETQPRLPGYVAVSLTNLRGAYLNGFERAIYAPLQQQKPVAVLGDCINIYWVEQKW